MEKVKLLINPFGRKSLLLILASIFLLTTALSTVAPARTNKNDRQKIARQVAENWIEVGTEEYQRGLYAQAERSFLRAQHYQKYLTAATREKLNKLLEKAHTAALERERILEHIQTADKLIKQRQLIEAKTHLEGVKDSKFLTEEERQKIAGGLKKLAKLLGKEPKEDRLPGTTPVAIEDELLGVVTGPGRDVEESAVGEVTHIERVNLKRRIRRRYARAVVTDANDKAQSYMSEGEFEKAKNVVDRAKRTVDEYQLDLGDYFFEQYNSKLKELSDEIIQRQEKRDEELEEKRRLAAIEAQKKLREKTEAQRKQRIEDLMENAMELQKKQKYPEALGQLKMLLVLEPLNDDALILKDTLEDMIYWRREAEIQKEASKERAEILLKTDEAGIPYAEALVHPKDWREIVASPFRKPDEAIGRDPADAAVYKQLDEIVDLSVLNPDMTFSQALGEIRNAVDPPLKIVVLWRDLKDNADIDQDMRINMGPISAAPLGTALDLLLKSVSSGLAMAELGYIVEHGVITIATKDSLPSKMETRVYDVTILLGRPAEYYGGGGGGGYGGGGYGGGGYGGGGYGGGGYGGGGYGGRGGYGGGGYGGGGYGGRGGYGGGGYGGGGYGGGGYGGGGYGGRGGYGGGGYGGRGGYGGGGYGGGGYGGRGGYGGGGYGGGGYGGRGGGYGGGGYGGGFGMGMGGYDYEKEYREGSLLMLIQETVSPDSWYEAGGEGTITSYEGKKLIIYQTPEIHNEIAKLLKEMRKALGHQVSIEARFLVVTENFLEDIGIDLELAFKLGGVGSKWSNLGFQQGHYEGVKPAETKVAGSLAKAVSGLNLGSINQGILGPLSYGGAADDLMVSFLLRAVQAHKDSKILTAPKLTVLSGESATFSVETQTVIALPPEVSQTVYPTGITTTPTTQAILPTFETIPSGTSLNITPIISPDKKHVLLDITTTLNDFLGMKSYNLETPMPDGTIAKYSQELPETEWSQVQTRVSVPDGGTLLLGGQKITAEVEMEAGVPGLSKIPLVGRLFRNRSTVKDQKILLILVTPTIILQEEADAKAIGAFEGNL